MLPTTAKATAVSRAMTACRLGRRRPGRGGGAAQPWAPNAAAAPRAGMTASDAAWRERRPRASRRPPPRTSPAMTTISVPAPEVRTFDLTVAHRGRPCEPSTGRSTSIRQHNHMGETAHLTLTRQSDRSGRFSTGLRVANRPTPSPGRRRTKCHAMNPTTISPSSTYETLPSADSTFL